MLPLSSRQVQAEQYLFALVLHAIRTRIGPGRGRRNAARGAGGGVWESGFNGGGPSACDRCGGAADRGCPLCAGTGVSLSDLGLDDECTKKGKTKSKKKRERRARAKAAKKVQEAHEANEASGAACSGPCGPNEVAGGQVGRLAGATGGRSPRSDTPHPQRNTKSNAQRRKGRSTEPQPSPGASNAKGAGVTGARERAGSSGMETAGSLLSMLGRGVAGICDAPEDEDGDEGIDEDLFMEMERLRLQKARTDVQRSRAALRSSLQKNFDQLLVSSTASNGRHAGEGAR